MAFPWDLSVAFASSFIVLIIVAAAEDSCPNDGSSGGPRCSSAVETPVDYVAMAGDLEALNRSLGNKLHEIRRVPCRGEWLQETKPVILEGCCWALESAFQKGDQIADCSNDEDFLPLEYFGFSHQFFLEQCGEQDMNKIARNEPNRIAVASIRDAKDEALLQEYDRQLREVYNISWDGLLSMLLHRELSFDQYVAEMRRFEVRTRPKHYAGYFSPLSLSSIRSLWCPVLAEQVAEKGYPMLSLYRHLPGYGMERRQHRENAWAAYGYSFLGPKHSFGHPPHLNTDPEDDIAVLLEGKKHWQLVAATRNSFSDLQPLPGTSLWQNAFSKVPIDIADDYPVYVGTQSKGEVLIFRKNWVHLAYNLEDSTSLLLRQPLLPENHALI